MTNKSFLPIAAALAFAPPIHSNRLAIRWILWACDVHLLGIVLEALDLFDRVIQEGALIVLTRQSSLGAEPRLELIEFYSAQSRSGRAPLRQAPLNLPVSPRDRVQISPACIDATGVAGEVMILPFFQ
jgi:hypothetical protein